MAHPVLNLREAGIFLAGRLWPAGIQIDPIELLKDLVRPDALNRRGYAIAVARWKRLIWFRRADLEKLAAMLIAAGGTRGRLPYRRPAESELTFINRAADDDGLGTLWVAPC